MKNSYKIAQGILGSNLNISRLEKHIKENRFSRGQECPRCFSKDLNKNGKTSGRQIYICKHCRRTFDEMTNSPLSHTKISLDKWLKYCELMITGGTIRACASEIEVSIPTSFFMRHRILDVLNLILKQDTIEGIVEVDETYIRESYKGNHSKSTDFIIPREPRKRGEI